MAEAAFHYNGITTIIQCQENQKMSEICDKFISKSNLNENELIYFYDGKVGAQFDKNLTFYQMANSIDKSRKKMNILVINNKIINNNKSTIKSKNIICQQCYENVKIKIDNYKIDLLECKNGHSMNKISLNEFENTQIINLKNIKCDICKKKNKYNTYNNEFYKCYECNKNICPLCKIEHDKLNHNIYNYDIYKYICNKHNDSFTNYCNNCKINLCTICEEDHVNHDKILLSKMMINKNKLINKLEELKKL